VLQLTKQFADEMTAHAQTNFPKECCGILAGTDDHRVLKLYRITNVEHSPYRYLMAPREQYEAMKDCERNNWEFIAFYHSHTHSEAYPSATDIRMASNWPDPYYILVSLADKEHPNVRAFHILDGQVTEEELQII
jgi:proteasome lid subunit RPN8/RPN11